MTSIQSTWLLLIGISSLRKWHFYALSKPSSGRRSLSLEVCISQADSIHRTAAASQFSPNQPSYFKDHELGKTEARNSSRQIWDWFLLCRAEHPLRRLWGSNSNRTFTFPAEYVPHRKGKFTLSVWKTDPVVSC